MSNGISYGMDEMRSIYDYRRENACPTCRDIEFNFPDYDVSIEYITLQERKIEKLEIDISNFVQDVDYTKSLDTKSTVVPLSTLNPSDYKVTLSALPAFTGTSTIPIFSNESNSSATILGAMLRKNVKLYASANLISYAIINFFMALIGVNFGLFLSSNLLFDPYAIYCLLVYDIIY